MSSIGTPGAFPTCVKRRFSLAMLLVAGIMPLQCATLERLSLDDLIAKSTAIVRGKVTGAAAAFSGPVIYTHYTIQVSEQFKGAGQNSIDVVVPGGTANGLRQSFAGAPVLNPGDEFVFFLYTGKSGLTTVTGLTQGLFSLPGDGSTDPTLTRSASRELMLDPANGRPVKDETLTLKLSDLRQRIKTQVKGASAK